MDLSQDDRVPRALEDLLKVVKLAMPPELFLVDPRVLSARQLLADLHQISSSRPPSVVRKLSTIQVFDLALSDTPLDMLSAEPEYTWDITLGLDRFMASGLAPVDRKSAIEQILREWLTSNGYLQLAPEEPN